MPMGFWDCGRKPASRINGSAVVLRVTLTGTSRKARRGLFLFTLFPRILYLQYPSWKIVDRRDMPFVYVSVSQCQLA